MRRPVVVLAWGRLAHAGTLVSFAAEPPPPALPERLPGLKAAAQVTRDTSGIAHIRARTSTTCSSCRATCTPRTACSRWT